MSASALTSPITEAWLDKDTYDFLYAIHYPDGDWDEHPESIPPSFIVPPDSEDEETLIVHRMD